MRKLAIGTLLALLAAASPALANADSDRLNQAGMLGSWAVDCNKPPSGANPYQLFAPSSSGAPTRTLQMDNPGLDGTLTIKNVRVVGSDRVGLSWTDRDGRTYNMVLLKAGNRHKGYNSVRVNDNKVLVTDGHFVSSGKETPWFTKCGTK